MRSWTIYRHVSPSGKVYVGITSRSPKERWGHNGCSYRGQIFVNAINKYGWDNIKHEILFTNLTEQRAKNLEIELIRHYKGLGISYNMTDGGDGTVGLKLSEERRARLKEIMRNRDQSKFIGYLNSHREEIGIRHRKAVVQFTLDGHYVATYDGVKFASAATKIDGSMISACCKKRQFRAGDYLWMYEKDYNTYKSNESINSILESMIIKANTPSGKYERNAEWRQAVSERLKGVDRRSDGTKKFMQQRSVETNSIPIMQLTLKDEIINVFKNGREIKMQLGCCNSYISKCCKGIKEAAYGYKWKFITKEEYNEYKKQLEAA